MTGADDGEGKLRLVHNVDGAAPRPWPDNAEEEAREQLEEILRDCDRFMIVGVQRCDDGGSRVLSYYARRGVRVSALELVGAVYSRLHDWLNEL